MAVAEIDEKKQKKLDRLLSLLDPENALSKEDFVNSFQKVVELVLQVQKRQQEAIDSLEKTYARLLSKMDSDHSSRYEELKGQTNQLFVGEQLKRMDGETKASFEKRQRELSELIDKKLREADERVSQLKPIKGDKGDRGDTGPMPTEHLGLLKEVREELKKVKDILSNIPRGKAMGRAKVPIMRPVNLTSSVDGSTRSFTLPRDTTQIIGMWGSQFPFTMDQDVDFTLRGNVVTLNDQVATPVAGQTLWALVEVLFYP